jgi:hypothetical protein
MKTPSKPCRELKNLFGLGNDKGPQTTGEAFLGLSAIEREASNPLSGTLARIEAALAAEGIAFLPDGVRLERPR